MSDATFHLCIDALRECVSLAERAVTAGSAAVGAVLTDSTGAIVARGRNRSREPFANDGRIGGAPIAHAEMDAIFALGNADPSPLTLYCSLEPCPMCATAIAMIGIRRVVFAAYDPAGGAGRVLDWGKNPLKPISVIAAPDPKIESHAATLFAPEAHTLFSGHDWELWRQRYPLETQQAEGD